MGPQSSILKIDNVTVRFGGIVALDDVSFEMEKGTTLGLIGPNGAGKTTLFNCLSRLYTPSSGDVSFCGSSILAFPSHRIASLGIGRTFQNVSLFPTMTVLDNVKVGTHSRIKSNYFADGIFTNLTRENEAFADSKARQLIDYLCLSDVRERKVAELPFGTQKRVELARALALEPKLLLLDEPACGLNHEEVAALEMLIKRIRVELSLSVLLVEHHMALVMSLSDKIVALNFGKKLAEGSPAEIRQSPAVIAAYLGGGA